MARILVLVNINIKDDTTTDFEERKQNLHTSLFEYLIKVLKHDLNSKLIDSERARHLNMMQQTCL